MIKKYTYKTYILYMDRRCSTIVKYMFPIVRIFVVVRSGSLKIINAVGKMSETEVKLKISTYCGQNPHPHTK